MPIRKFQAMFYTFVHNYIHTCIHAYMSVLQRHVHVLRVPMKHVRLCVCIEKICPQEHKSFWQEGHQDLGEKSE